MQKNTFASLLALAMVFTACSKDKKNGHRYVLDASSVVEWTGSTDETSNTGSLDITSDNIIVEDGEVVGGSFEIPIATLKNFNLPTAELKKELLDHLKTVDFFNMAVYPTASFIIQKLEPYDGQLATEIEEANYYITGDLVMIGKAQTIMVPAKIEVKGNRLHVEAVFEIDRTKWGMNFASDPDAMPYIHPEVELHLKASATRQ